MPILLHAISVRKNRRTVYQTGTECRRIWKKKLHPYFSVLRSTSLFYIHIQQQLYSLRRFVHVESKDDGATVVKGVRTV